MDQCRYCGVKGNYDECMKTACSLHETWIMSQYVEKLKKLEIKCLKEYDSGFDEGYDEGFVSGFDECLE